mgnify:CR=1 FL=1
MKRFYDQAAVAVGDNAWSVVLDGRPVKTPARLSLTVPYSRLAEALAAEWQDQVGEIDPATMPLTRLANTALDRTASRRQQVIEEVAGYGQCDLLCYRAASPDDLVERQAREWQPILDWLADTHAAPLAVTPDIAPLEQKNDPLLAIYSAVARQNDFFLTGLHAATTICGSVALGLALIGRRIDAAEASASALLDERYQADRWGVDVDAEARWAAQDAELATIEKFLSLAQ